MITEQTLIGDEGSVFKARTANAKALRQGQNSREAVRLEQREQGNW